MCQEIVFGEMHFYWKNNVWNISLYTTIQFGRNNVTVVIGLGVH